MVDFAVTLEGAAGTDGTTIGDISCTTNARRAWVYDFSLSSDGTPADTGFEWVAQRTTGHGTRGSAVVPTRLDLADAESDADTGQAHTIEPTYTATEELFDIALNLRATYRWVAAPGGEWVIPATDNAGIGWKCNHASATDNQKISAQFRE